MVALGSFKDRTGEVSIDYTILGPAGFRLRKTGTREYLWECLCVCGKVCNITYAGFKKGMGCGCRYHANRKEKFKAFRADQIGKEINGWRIVEFSHLNDGKCSKEAIYKCACLACGSIKDYAINHLKNKKDGTRCNTCSYTSKQYNQELPWGFILNHKQEHARWVYMNLRCDSKNHPRYGARGISVCEEWRQINPKGFVNYVTWLNKNYPDYLELMSLGYQVDRENNNLGYSPENCRLIPIKENAKNKETTIKVCYLGEEGIPLIDLVREFSLNSPRLVSARIRAGWDVERALITPKIENNKESREMYRT